MKISQGRWLGLPALLAAGGDDVRIIAGGQTLVPLMAMRLARPKRLIEAAYS